MYVKLKFFRFKLSYEATFGFVRNVKLKLQNIFLIPTHIKIILLYLFFILYFFYLSSWKKKNQPLRTKSEIVSLGHDAKSAQHGLKVRSLVKLMQGWVAQSCQGSLHPLSFHASYSNQWVLHHRSTHAKPILQKRHVVVASIVVTLDLVEAASKRAWMQRRRTHTRLLQG